jgi:serine/threonine-protein kinase HipA
VTNEPLLPLLPLSDMQLGPHHRFEGADTSGHRRGIVSLNGTRAGLIEETPQGSRFTYDQSYLALPGALPISPTLPLQPEPYPSSGLHPFFENLLPEGWLLDQTCRKLALDPADAFGVMLATCRDCAGAVEILPEAS